jgi:hypothetical protein
LHPVRGEHGGAPYEALSARFRLFPPWLTRNSEHLADLARGRLADSRDKDRFVKSAKGEGRKSPIFADDEVIGFGVANADSTAFAPTRA